MTNKKKQKIAAIVVCAALLPLVIAKVVMPHFSQEKGATEQPSIDPNNDLDLGNYNLVWSDEFDGDSLNQNDWNIEVNGSGGGNQELQFYRAENVSVGKEPQTGASSMILTAKRESHQGREITSGRVNTMGKVTYKYGRIDARIRLPKTADGLWPAFWVMGDDFNTVGWPACGEIDVLEMGNVDGIKAGAQDRHLIGAMHWGKKFDGFYEFNAQDTIVDKSLQDGFNLFTMIWDQTSVRSYVNLDKNPDAKPYFSYDISQTEGENAIANFFHKPFFVIFNLAVGGKFPVIYDPAKITALDGGDVHMYVDYVRIYQRK